MSLSSNKRKKENSENYKKGKVIKLELKDDLALVDKDIFDDNINLLIEKLKDLDSENSKLLIKKLKEFDLLKKKLNELELENSKILLENNDLTIKLKEYQNDIKNLKECIKKSKNKIFRLELINSKNKELLEMK